MATRAVYTFKDQHNKFSVYNHYDGYPSGAIESLKAGFGNAWGNGRYEAAEAAAAYVAANKRNPGQIYLTKGPQYHFDLDWDYVISRKDGGLYIDVYNHGTQRRKFFSGSLEDFYEKYESKE